VRREHHWVRRCSAGCPDNGPYYTRPDNSRCAWCGARVRIVRLAGGRPIHTSHPHHLSQKGFTPHYNEGFGRRVEDAHDFKKLLNKHGCEEAPESDRHNIPRDFH